MSSARTPLVGILLVGLGLLFLADQLGVAHFSAAFTRWWPAILIAAGAADLIERRALRTGPLVLVGIGAVLLLANLGYVQLATLGRLWPLALVLLGGWMLLRDRGRRG